MNFFGFLKNSGVWKKFGFVEKCWICGFFWDFGEEKKLRKISDFWNTHTYTQPLQHSLTLKTTVAQKYLVWKYHRPTNRPTYRLTWVGVKRHLRVLKWKVVFAIWPHLLLNGGLRWIDFLRQRLHRCWRGQVSGAERDQGRGLVEGLSSLKVRPCFSSLPFPSWLCQHEARLIFLPIWAPWWVAGGG